MTLAVVRRLVGEKATITPLAGGVTALVYRVSDGSHHTVVKVIRGSYGAEFRRAAVTLEFASLQAAAQARVEGVRFVRPLRVWPDEGAYEMAFESAVSALQARLQHPSTVARRLMEGFRAFTESCGRPFGDVHLGNVLVSRDGDLVLIDPISADDVRREVAGASLTAAHDTLHHQDLVALTAIEALLLARRFVTSPRQAVRAVRVIRAFSEVARRRIGQTYDSDVRDFVTRHARGQGWAGRAKLPYRRAALELMLGTTPRTGAPPKQ